jgi:hypothetical protein
MSLDGYPIEPVLEEIIHYINQVFYGIFLIEMVLKQLGYGFKSYF